MNYKPLVAHDLPPFHSPGDSGCAEIDSKDTFSSKRISLVLVLRLVLLAAGVWVVVAGLRAAASVLAPVVAASFIALVLGSPVPWLSRFMPRWLAALLIAVVWLAALTGLVLFFPLWSPELVALYNVVIVELMELTELGRQVAAEYRVAFPDAVPAGQWVVDAGSLAIHVAMGLLTTVLFAGFILAELWGLPQKVAVAFGGDKRRLALFADVAAHIREYFHLKTLVSAITGLIVGGACALVGIDLALLWGLLAFALNYVPTIGSIVAAVPPVVLAAATLGWEHALVLGLVYLVTNAIIGAYLEPKILGDRMDLSPLVVLLSLAFWGWVWGPIGMLLAVPMTVVFKIIMAQIDELRPFAVLLGSSAAHAPAPVPSIKPVLDRPHRRPTWRATSPAPMATRSTIDAIAS